MRFMRREDIKKQGKIKTKIKLGETRLISRNSEELMILIDTDIISSNLPCEFI